MRSGYLRLLAAALTCQTFVATAQPVANLPLTCSSASAIGQPQNNCSGVWAYQTPNEQLVVLRGPASTWALAANLAGTDTIAVCSLPVEPGVYSGCKDASGVRRIVYLAKSQVFTSSPPPPPPPPPGPTPGVLDLTRLPVEITQPGLYVLDRNWNVGDSSEGIIVISANDVTFDLRGFELETFQSGVNASGQRVVIRNGSVRSSWSGYAITASGANSLIEQVNARAYRGGAVRLSGVGSTLKNSTAHVSEGGVAVGAGDDTIIRDSAIGSRFDPAISVASRTTIVDNTFASCVAGPCVRIAGSNNLVSRNSVRPLSVPNSTALLVVGNANRIFDNEIAGCTSAAGLAISVEGRSNVLRDNTVPYCDAGGRWGTGIAFSQDGNFYGDNTVWATVPFDVGATVQTDLGGNAGITQ